MAKYIKTEEGYKTLNEINGTILLRGENYIEVKDDIVRTTFGDVIKTEEESIKEYCNSLIATMNYNPSFGGYATPYTGTCSPVIPPQNGEILEIEITTYSGVFLFKGSAVYKGDSTGGRAESHDGLTIVFSNEYTSLGATNIILIYPTNVSGNSLKIVGKQKKPVDGYVTLPKTALNYDDMPIENSDNLLTSGTIYNIIQNLQSQINNLNNGGEA